MMIDVETDLMDWDMVILERRIRFLLLYELSSGTSKIFDNDTYEAIEDLAFIYKIRSKLLYGDIP